MEDNKKDLLKRFCKVREASVAMCAPLEAEQCRIQPSCDVSPPWWNLAHTSWFFARNLLRPFSGKVTKEDELFDYILNSYYVSLGPRLERDRRGLMTRPTMKEVYDYRESVDKRMVKLIQSLSNTKLQACAPIIDIGIQHEQQHQELFYTEIKYILYQNPPALRQPYLNKEEKKSKKTTAPASQLVEFAGGLHEFGNLENTWGWDNEYPIHKFYLNAFGLQNRLTTNKEFLEFMQDGGYANQLLWLNNGWNKVQEQQWKAPLYWENVDGEWHIWTLSGMKKLNFNEPVCHVSFYEAEAFATWKKARLSTEREWEFAARQSHLDTSEGNFLDERILHPRTSPNKEKLNQMLGDVWEWTSSYYEPYPGYTPFAGSLSEYNEKFMDNQRVIRGGSCVSERDHIHISYRNFWSPETRFQFTGIRLAEDLGGKHGQK